MALIVSLAHTGQRLQADPASFASLDAFKIWVSKNSKIATQDQISLTSQGKALRFPALSSEKEIYIFDRRIVSSASLASSKSLQFDIPVSPKYNPSRPPDTIADQNDLQAWKDLFMARRSWAVKIVDDCAGMSDEAQKRYQETEVIRGGLNAAVTNLEKHVRGLDQKNAETQSWAADVKKEQEMAGTDSEATMARLRTLPATNEMIRFITGRDNLRHDREPTLEDLVNPEDVKSAMKQVRKVSSQLARDCAELGVKVDQILKRTDDLYDKSEKNSVRSIERRVEEPEQLMQDIEAIARKVSNDYETVLGYQTHSKNVSQASKSALHHTRNLLPNLLKRSQEMDGILRTATETRNTVAADSLDCMHDIARLTSMVADANGRFAALDLDSVSLDAFHTLSTVNSLPVIYASFMSEAIRRREWNDKVRSDSSTLANEMASFQDEEAKRRRKWQKSTGATLWGEKAERKVVGLEVNVRGEDEELPLIERTQLEELLGFLKQQDSKSANISEVTRIIQDLNNPTKQQTKRAKAFKAGSMHEAALGRSALLMRGDDELIRVLQDEKQKTESKLKTAESRVRRLEDLLHRQTQINRTSTGNVFQLPGHPSPESQNINAPLASPRLQDDMSRRSSFSSRRFSANQSADEKVYQQKLLTLEAELIAERERISALENEVSARKNMVNDMKVQVEEVNSTKKDLLSNFDAQQREFVEERISLETEIDRLKTKLEELEDEIDRFAGSRENVDHRVRSLQDELEKLRKEKEAEAQKNQGQVDFLRNDAKLQRETNETLEKKLQRMTEENKELLTRAELSEAIAQQHVQALKDVHGQLLPTTTIPEDINSLADTLVGVSGDLVAELESVKSDALIARSDRDASQAAIAKLKSMIEQTNEQLSAEEKASAQLHDKLTGEQAKFTALEAELADERNQLSTLRSKISDGETGSEVLRTRLEEEEKKVTRMSEELASQQAHIGGLEEESRTFQDKYQSVQAKHDNLNSRFEARTSRVKDLTQRVYAQNDRLCRLLERLSYSVTRESGSMIIQRIPKPERSNANDSSDPGSTLRRSITGAATRKAMVDSGDLELLYWMHNDDSEIESEKYHAYLDAIGNFDVESFCEVITKRIKDMEYTAKKYSKDARAYREKSHIAQKEAHEKIAFKNFKEGDLALFLPTRNQATGAWAAFNVGAPHYFLREQDSHKLRTRDWLLARIHRIEDRVVDLSKSMSTTHLTVDRRSVGEISNGGDSFEDDNPFDLSDGLRWYLIDAAEEKPGAPSTPGLGKSTIATAVVDATGSIRRSKKSSSSGVENLNKTLSKSLESRRSSNNSKKSIPATSTLLVKTSATPTDASSLKAAPTTQVGGGEASEAQMIPSSSRQEGIENASGDKVLNPENNVKSGEPSSGTSPSKKSMIWDSLWSLDVSLEHGKKK